MSNDEPAAGLKAAFLQQRPLLQRLLIGRLQNCEDAEDALQEMWLKLDALEANGHDSRPVAQPVAYMCRMAMNLAADRRISALRDGRRDTAWMEVQPMPEEFADAERQLIGRDILARLEATMARMPDRMRQALRLFRVEGVSQRDIAATLGITVSGVEKLLKRAHHQIHDSWDRHGADRSDQDRLIGREDIARDE